MTVRLGGTAPEESKAREPGEVNVRTDMSRSLECDDAVHQPAFSLENEGFDTSPAPTMGNTGNTSGTEDKTPEEIPYRCA